MRVLAKYSGMTAIDWPIFGRVELELVGWLVEMFLGSAARTGCLKDKSATMAADR